MPSYRPHTSVNVSVSSRASSRAGDCVSGLPAAASMMIRPLRPLHFQFPQGLYQRFQHHDHAGPAAVRTVIHNMVAVFVLSRGFRISNSTSPASRAPCRAAPYPAGTQTIQETESVC